METIRSGAILKKERRVRLRMISSGTLVATVEPGNADVVLQRLGEIGILCSDVGTVEQGDGVELIDGDKTYHFHEIRCEDDELARMWTLYPR